LPETLDGATLGCETEGFTLASMAQPVKTVSANHRSFDGTGVELQGLETVLIGSFAQLSCPNRKYFNSSDCGATRVATLKVAQLKLM